MPAIASLLKVLLLSLAVSLARAQGTPDDCRDRVQPSATLEQDRIAGLKYSCLRIDGRRVLVAEAGDATRPTVLLVHGLGNNAHRDWRAAYPGLAESFRVVAIDLPGFGASDPLPGGYSFEQLDATLISVSQQLALPRFHLVGHSLGGAVSLYFAARHPERIDRLVLVDAAGVLLQQVFTRQLIEANRATGSSSLDAVMGMLGTNTDSVIDMLQDRMDISGLIMANPALADAVLGRQIHADAALGLVKHNFTSAIREMRSPTTIIWGADDRITPLRTGELLASRLTDARLQVIPGARHMPMMEATAEFNRLLVAALVDPLPPKQSSSVTGATQGDVKCTERADAVYTGVFDRLSLSNCPNARIENARAREISIDNSNVTLRQVSVDGNGVALQAINSQITATVIDLKGKIAIRADGSRIDVAGARLQATEKSVESAGSSRLYFSVSEIDAPDYRGDAHRVWPPR